MYRNNHYRSNFIQQKQH